MGKIRHRDQTGAPPDDTALIDGPKWDADHDQDGPWTPSQGGTGVANDDASTITISGAYAITLNVSAETNLTLPTTGTLATLDLTFWRTINPTGADGDNIFAGEDAGNDTLSPGGGASTLASENLGIGINALHNLTTGYRNVAIGNQTLPAVTEGYSNVAIGYGAMPSLSTGNSNVAIGDNSMGFGSTATANTAVGLSTLYKITTGGHNTALGLQAGYNVTTGSNNTFVGRDSGYSNTDGESNTSVGVDSNPGNSTGDENVAVGRNSLYGDDHTDASTNQNLTGSQNVAVGFGASFTGGIQNLNNCIMIGHRAKATASNQVVLGNSNHTTTFLFGTVRAPKVYLSGTAGEGYLEMPAQSGSPGAPASGNRYYTDASERPSWLKTTGISFKIDPVLLTTSRILTLPDASGTLVTLDATQELDNKTLDASVAKGTWTASGAWTIPAVTLGGTVSGGGNQINNVIIGSSTPLAGTFTTLTAGGGGQTATIGPGGTGALNAFLALNGANATAQGAFVSWRKNATAGTIWFLGHVSAIEATGTSSDLEYFNANTSARTMRLSIADDSVSFASTVDANIGTGAGAINTLGGIYAAKAIASGTSVTATTFLKAGSFTVAGLPAGTAGSAVWCSNCRVFNGAGTQEGVGAGTGGLVTYNGSAWKIAGTNVTAIA
ncbi:hypothetical protein JQ628_11330 [Bradyrhizobium lablabi]|uniref:hypothetical protein n=1 Tax=Bradyrhizobium lablabi TaxID=722472 RepID=UPI001BAB3980|nr:hypothetical protein [Bradyrhizobium lablabi]MBR1122108.1 hypothetical protein [Bradyrhizobium lablabi]